VSFPEETMLELMSYADGEPLEPAARARVEELLRTNEEARRVVDAMGALGDAVRDGIDGRAAGGEHGAKADGIAEGVMAAIATGVSAAHSTRDVGGRVVPLSARERRARVVVNWGIAGGFALAAGIMLLLSTVDDGAKVARVAPALSEVRSAERATEAIAASAEAKVAGVIAAEEHGVDLEEVRSIENKVNVFFVRAKKGGAVKDEEKTSLVIWIDDRHQGR
jgi:hypothetical protein